jgi:hypothetical protein
MKVIVDTANGFHTEKNCNEVMECLGYYALYLSILREQLGLCYGLDNVHKFPDPGEYVNECLHGYIKIVI